MSDDEAEFEMVMPFVAVESKGGPYADDAYVAGYEAGRLSTLIEQHAPLLFEAAVTVRTANVAQIDLLAMSADITVGSEAWSEDPEWSFVRFTPAGSVE